MSRNSRKFIIGIAMLTLAVLAAMSLWHSKPFHNDDLGKLAPLQKETATMSLAEVARVLQDQ